jgi:hypothetical protein
MQRTPQAKAASMSSDQDGRHAGRIMALSMGILFSLIFLLHAFGS